MKTKIINKASLLARNCLLVVVMFCILVIMSACGSDSSDGDVIVYSDHSAFNFDATNTEVAAEMAASAMSFFPIYAELSQTVITVFRIVEPMYSPFTLSQILCVSGRVVLYWDDNDVSRDFSAGDSASLQLADCDLMNGTGDTVSGSIDIDFSTVDESQPGFSSTHTALVDVTIGSAIAKKGFVSAFSGSVDTADGRDYSSVYTAADTNDQTLAISESGVDYLTLGCFSVKATYDLLGLLNDRTVDLSFGGAINASDKILSLDGGSTVSVLIGIFEFGTQRLLSMSEPNCVATGTLHDVADSDGSYIDMEMLGGNVVQLSTYDRNDDPTFSIVTTWDQLTD